MEFVAALQRNDLIARVWALLLTPKREWLALSEEAGDLRGLYVRLILPLAAIPPAAKLIGWTAFGYLDLRSAILGALLGYGLTLAGVAVLAIAASKLAPYFDGHESLEQGFKLVAYAAIPGWLGGIFHLIPAAGLLSLLASLYGIYLLILGVVPLMAVDEDRALGYAGTILGATVLLFIAFAGLIGMAVGIAAIGMA